MFSVIFQSGSDASDGGEIERFGKILDRAIETRNFEIQQLSNRNNFALVVQGILFAALFKSGFNTHGLEVVFLTSLGIMFSIVQIQMATGAKFWQIRWEIAASKAEERYVAALKSSDRIKLFSESTDEVMKLVHEDLKRRVERRSPGRWRVSSFDVFEDWLICRKFSPSRAPIRIALVLFVVWVALLVRFA